jgi:hypothetical protein
MEPGTPWDMTQHGSVLVGIRVLGTIVNEDRTTARVAFTPGPEVEVESVSFQDQPVASQRASSVSSSAPPKIAQQSDSYLLRPGMEVRISAILWRSALQWADEWTAGHVASPSVLGLVGVAATTGSALVNDTCQLQFGRYPFVPHPTQDGWVVAAIDITHNIPDPPRAPVAVIGRMERGYQ